MSIEVLSNQTNDLHRSAIHPIKDQLTDIKEILSKFEDDKKIKAFINQKDKNGNTVFEHLAWKNRADVILYLTTFYTDEERFEILKRQNANTGATIFHIFANHFDVHSLDSTLIGFSKGQKKEIYNTKDNTGYNIEKCLKSRFMEL